MSWYYLSYPEVIKSDMTCCRPELKSHVFQPHRAWLMWTSSRLGYSVLDLGGVGKDDTRKCEVRGFIGPAYWRAPRHAEEPWCQSRPWDLFLRGERGRCEAPGQSPSRTPSSGWPEGRCSTTRQFRHVTDTSNTAANHKNACALIISCSNDN